MPIATTSRPVTPFQTFSLAEAAQILCGSDSSGAQKFLSKRLRGEAEPALPGFKVQRRWRMTQADIDASVELLRPGRTVRAPGMTSMTKRSQQRLAV